MTRWVVGAGAEWTNNVRQLHSRESAVAAGGNGYADVDQVSARVLLRPTRPYVYHCTRLIRASQLDKTRLLRLAMITRE